MKTIFKKICCIFILLLSFPVYAETIKIIVPWSAGGIADKIARSVQKSLLTHLPVGTTVIVENHPSANGIIGTRLVAGNKKKETVLLLTTSLGVLYQMQQAETVALEQHLLPVAYLGSVKQALIASKKSNLNSIIDLRNADRALFYGSSIGVGSANYRDRLQVLGVTGKAVDSVPSLSNHKLQNFDQSLLQLVLFANSTADPQTIKQIQNALYNSYISNEKDNYINAGLDIDLNTLLTADLFFVVQVPILKSILIKLKIDQVDTKDK